MFPLQLDSYQSKVRQLLPENDFVVVRGGKFSGKSYLLRSLCAEAVLEGSRVLLVVQNEQEARMLISQMQRYFLRNECLLIQPDKKVSLQILERIREEIDKEAQPFDNKSFNEIQNAFNALNVLVQD